MLLKFSKPCCIHVFYRFGVHLPQVVPHQPVQFLGFLWHFFDQIVLLAKVLNDVMESCRSRVQLAHEFEITESYGRNWNAGVIRIMKDQRWRGPLDFASISMRQHRPPASTIDILWHRLTATAQVVNRWKQIPLRHGNVALDIGQDAGSAHYRRHPQAALEHPCLAAGQGTVVYKTAAVIRGEDDVRIVRNTSSVERFEDAAETAIQVVDHGGILQGP